MFIPIEKYIKIYQGGSTGLVQQKKLKKDTLSRPKTRIIKAIKDVLKQEFKFDLVLIQVGYYIEIIEEDAKYFKENFGLKIHDAGGTRPYEVTGFGKNGLEKYINSLNTKGVKFCVVEQVDVGEKKVTRSVTYSPMEKDALGCTF